MKSINCIFGPAPVAGRGLVLTDLLSGRLRVPLLHPVNCFETLGENQTYTLALRLQKLELVC
jgi:hypothetical protein